MYSYIVRGLAFGAVTIRGVCIVVFFVLRVLPGDRLVAIFGPEEQPASYMAQLGLRPADRGLAALGSGHLQRWAGSFVLSLRERRRDVRSPLTLIAEIAAISVAPSWLVGIPVAIVSALRSTGIGDNISRPPQHSFPGGAWFLVGYDDSARAAVCFWLPRPFGESIFLHRSVANMRIVVDPALVLGLAWPIASRMACSSPLEMVNEDYVRAAPAKELNRRLVIDNACTHDAEMSEWKTWRVAPPPRSSCTCYVTIRHEARCRLCAPPSAAA